MKNKPTSARLPGYSLDHLSVLKLEGTDASSFLQGYVTCDLDQLVNDSALAGAFCNIQGRVLADFVILPQHQLGHQQTPLQPAYLLVLESSTVPKLLASMQKYLVFSKSTLSDCSSDWQLIGTVSTQHKETTWPAAVTTSLIAIDSDTARSASNEVLTYTLELGARTLYMLPADAEPLDFGFEPDLQTANAWIYQEILAGIPHITQATQEQFLPQALNLEKLGAVSFSKGCYLGQEIIARTQHRGKLKRKLIRMNWQGPSAPLPGEAIRTSDGLLLGQVIIAADQPAAEKPSSNVSLSGNLLALLSKEIDDIAFVNDIAIRPE